MAWVMFSLAAQAGHDGAAQSLRALGPTLSAEERKRAESVLHPQIAAAH
jgi:hypothetical protein